MGVLCAALYFLLPSIALCYVQVQPDMKTFSSAMKDGEILGGEEKVLYEHETGPGVVTEQWFAGVDVMDQDARFRFYIDGEMVASLDFQLYMAHGIGFNNTFEDKYLPWGTKLMSHSASGGGLSNTFRIPFLKSFRVTLTHPKGGIFWYIIRGVENYPLVLGDLLLPKTSRLKVYKQTNILLERLKFITLAKVDNSAGAVFMVTLAANSTDYTYLEACMRVIIDGGDVMFLSSGTEDFFLSAYYYNKGVFHFENSGLTSKEGVGTMSAYKFFERDPLLFAKSLELKWRCGEVVGGFGGCPTDFPQYYSPKRPPSRVDLYTNTTVTAYTWVYEWNY